MDIHMNRLMRRISATFAIAAIFFAQVAVSAYACPMGTPAAAEAAAQAAEAPPCHQADASLANLCRKHCSDDEQAQPAGAAPVQGFVPAFIVSLPVADGVHAVPGARASSASPHAPWPPPSIRFCCLRI